MYKPAPSLAQLLLLHSGRALASQTRAHARVMSTPVTDTQATAAAIDAFWAECAAYEVAHHYFQESLA